MLREQTYSGEQCAGEKQFRERLDHRPGLEAARVMAHHRVEHEEIRERHQARRQREPAMAELEVEREIIVEAKVHHDRTEADEHRQIALIERVESRCENLVGGVSDETEGVTAQGERGSL